MEAVKIVFVILCAAFVSVDGQPELAHEPKNIQAYIGDTVSFDCLIKEDHNNLSRLWNFKHADREDEDISMNDILFKKGHRSVYNEGRRLSITNVGIDDEGSYTCKFPQTDSLRQTNTLAIVVPPTVSMRPDLNLTSLLAGERLHLECRAEGRPEPRIIWTKDNNLLNDGNTTGELIIPQLAWNDGGIYKCLADNGVGDAAEEKIEVEVKFAPKLRIRYNKQVTGIGKSLNLECEVRSFPTASVIWLKNGTDVDMKGKSAYGGQRSSTTGVFTLSIGRVTQDDLGIYECKANNSLGNSSIDLEVTVLPQRLYISSDSQGTFSNVYTLSWQVDSEERLIEYHMLFRQKKLVESNTTEWANSTIPVTEPSVTNGKHSWSYKIEDLEANSTYYVKLRARNTAGLSDWTNQFEFYTSPVENKAPTPMTTRKVTIKNDSMNRKSSYPEGVEPTQPETKDNGDNSGGVLLPSVITLLISCLVTLKL